MGKLSRIFHPDIGMESFPISKIILPFSLMQRSNHYKTESQVDKFADKRVQINHKKVRTLTRLGQPRLK